MSVELIKYAFTSGEIAPNLHGRGDLTRYDLGMALAKNFYVDYRGGLNSRAGQELADFIKDPELASKFFEFRFSPDLSNTYLLVFTDYLIRFVQDAGYVLETGTAITDITQDSRGVFTAAAHGLLAGRWVKITDVVGMTELNTRTFEVTDVTTNTFSLKSLPERATLDTTNLTAYVSGGLVSAVYEIASPYPAAALDKVRADQYRDLIRFTHEDYPIQELVRSAATSWTMGPTDLTTLTTQATISSHTSTTSPDPDASNDAEIIFAVSSVLSDGSETLASPLYLVDDANNYTIEEGSCKVVWGAVPDAQHYFVYRSIISSSLPLDGGAEMGFIGRAYGTSFIDTNIIPDFTKKMVINSNPFEAGAITDIVITGAGTGYSLFGATVSVTGGGGSGFLGQVITDAAGAIVKVVVLNGGSGYSSAVVSFSGGGGSGATATATVRATTGIYPALSKFHQQRQVYAATANQPMTLFGSQPKLYDNFNTSEEVYDTDSYEFDVEVSEITPIRHMLSTRGGLLIITQEQMWLVNGGTVNTPVTATNALADPQTYTGASFLEPLTIGPDILFAEGRGYAVRMLAYNEISKVYSGEDRSIYSTHLFGKGKTVTRWCYQDSPFKIVWAVREDGVLLMFTVVKNEEVYAWTQGATEGKYKDIMVIREGVYDRVYVACERTLNGVTAKTIERMDTRDFINAEDAFFVDAGLKLGGTSPASNVDLTFVGSVFTLTASAAVFSANDVGKVVRLGNGIYDVTAYISTTELTMTQRVPATHFVEESEETVYNTVLSGDWTIDEPVTSVSGLNHLEGKTVKILADGNVQADQVVTDGKITLVHSATRVIVGLGYRAVAKTLPVIIPNEPTESRRKRLVGVGVRLDLARGLKAGRSLDDLYEVKPRSSESYGLPSALLSGYRYQMIASNWAVNGQTYFVQDDPLPVSLLGLVLDTEFGDDPD